MKRYKTIFKPSKRKTHTHAHPLLKKRRQTIIQCNCGMRFITPDGYTWVATERDS